MKWKKKKVTMEETENVSGGFDFGLDYRIRKREANIKCPVCGAEGKLATQYTGYEGNADGSYTATDECVCTNCGALITLLPEKNLLVVKDEDGFAVQENPYQW